MQWVNLFKRFAKVLIDCTLFAISLACAYKLRLEHNLSPHIQSWFWQEQLPFVISFVVSIRLAFLFIFQIYSKMWRYTETNEILELVKPIVVSSIFLAIPRALGFLAYTNIFSIPVGVIIIDSALSLIFLSFARLLRKWQISNRAIRKRKKISANKIRKRTLVIGAGVAAQELSRKVLQHPELETEIICALDDDIRKQNTKIAGNIKVKGQLNSLEKTIEDYNIEQIIIAIPSLPPKKIREIIELCQRTKLETHIIPGVDQLAEGKVTVESIRKVSLEDLLGREPVDLMIPEVKDFINNKTILITGAGGSIGSELAKQLVKSFHLKHLYILGRGENSIFQLSQELSNITKTQFTPIICDLRNYNQLYKHLVKTAPDVVFHSAAHKHVPLMEDHSQEAFENNVIGTNNLAKISGLLEVQTLVNISTDKAVNPISVMGSTKRFAELITGAYSKEFPKTKFVSVRFGNVIGSRGSVIPIWQFELKNNLPLTVTSKDAFRYFMTLQEAASLVIKASAVGKTSEIMVLDMGNEVNIYELLKDFIRLAGFNENEVKINFTGLRKGEKLKEELVGYYEGTNNTKFKKILVIEPNQTPVKQIKDTFNILCDLSQTLDTDTFKEKLLLEVKGLDQAEQKTVETCHGMSLLCI